MQLNFQPKNDLEIIGVHVLDSLTKKYPESYFVGGFVRDILLDRPVSDIDIATIATPEQVTEALYPEFETNNKFKSFGIVKTIADIEIATFRVETYRDSRYPKVAFVDSIEADSLRRDFTINSLYMSGEGEILDFHGGLADLGAGLVKFIGDPQIRIQEDPLRLVRAIRFALQLNFLLDSGTAQAIEKNFPLLENIKSRLMADETKKLSQEQEKKFKIIINSKVLDESLVNSYNGVV
jgi:tRNA nucleotidyltransferase (CCA-adding enzyme)